MCGEAPAPAAEAAREGGNGKDQRAEPVREPAGAEAAQRPAPVPAAPREALASDPDIPAGTEMATMTVREALRDAMAEEMRRDGDVFVMGEEVAEYQGAYKVTQGLLDEFGARPGHRHADHRARLCRPRRRRRALPA